MRRPFPRVRTEGRPWPCRRCHVAEQYDGPLGLELVEPEADRSVVIGAKRQTRFRARHTLRELPSAAGDVIDDGRATVLQVIQRPVRDDCSTIDRRVQIIPGRHAGPEDGQEKNHAIGEFHRQCRIGVRHLLGFAFPGRVLIRSCLSLDLAVCIVSTLDASFKRNGAGPGIFPAIGVRVGPIIMLTWTVLGDRKFTARSQGIKQLVRWKNSRAIVVGSAWFHVHPSLFRGRNYNR